MSNYYNDQWRLPNNENKDKQSNYSLSFDGSSNQEISLGTISQISSGSDFSISLWFKSEHTGGYDTMFGSGTAAANDIYIAIDESKNIEIGVRGQRLINVETIVNDIWYHFVLTVEGTTYKAYLDNGTPTTGNAGTTTSNSGDNAVLGDFSWTGNFHFNGQMDGVSIFDYALSASQITTLYGSSSTGIGNPMSLSPAPVSYYPLGDQDAFDGAEYLVPNSSLKDYVFDFGGNDYINCGNDSSLQITGAITISFWLKSTTVTSNIGGIITKSDNGNYFGSTGQKVYEVGALGNFLYFQISSGTAVTASAFNIIPYLDGNWHNIIALWDGTTNTNSVQIYIDSINVKNDQANISSIQNKSNDVVISSKLNTYDYTGELSNVQIFNTALPATGSNSIETLYNNGSPLTSMSGFTSLQGWWKLDASATYDGSDWTIPDSSSNSNDGTSSGMTQANLVQSDLSFTSGYSPYALSFDGANDYINLDSFAGELSTGDAYGLSVWFKGDGNNNTDGVLFSAHTSSRGNVVRLLIRDLSGSTVIQYLDGGNNGFFQGDYDNNKWHNVVVTKSTGTSTLTLYIDGSSIGTISNCNPDFSNATLFSIGQEWDASGTGDFFSGQISNVQIFNTALTDGTGGTVNQIETLYNNGTPLADMSSFSSLVSWWKLNNTTTGIEDSKGSNNGTNNGATEYAGFVNTLVGDSSGMSQSNLVQSDLQTVAPYSKYALSFDSGSSDRIDTGAKILNNMTSYTASIWAKGWSTSTLTAIMSQYDGGSVSPLILTARHSSNTNGFTAWLTLGGTFYTSHNDEGFSDNTKWVNLTVTWDGSDLILYVNGIAGDVTSASGTIDNSTTYNFHIGGYSNVTSNSYDGQLSNCSVWNTALTQSQVTEIYNEGLPSNLNSHSAYSNLISWWQLGENSSFNGNDWIVADEIGSNNGESDGMGVDALTNGVGTTANGVSSGMSEGSLVGDAPYSTANAISSGMPVTARGTDVPPTP